MLEGSSFNWRESCCRGDVDQSAGTWEYEKKKSPAWAECGVAGAESNEMRLYSDTGKIWCEGERSAQRAGETSGHTERGNSGIATPFRQLFLTREFTGPIAGKCR